MNTAQSSALDSGVPAHTPQRDQFQALRDALAAIPEPYGEWSRGNHHVYVEESEEWPQIDIQFGVNKLVRPKIARYVQACNPATIRALLDAMDDAINDRAAIARATARNPSDSNERGVTQ